MTNQLTRVQVYLDQDNLHVIDRIAKLNKKSRSEIIRKAVSREVKEHFYKEAKRDKKTTNILLEMAGKGGISKTGTIGLNVDEIYLSD